ncbi:hypothetical protein LEMLEM_LOCUS10131 [Lemmus lemmus]
MSQKGTNRTVLVSFTCQLCLTWSCEKRVSTTNTVDQSCCVLVGCFLAHFTASWQSFPEGHIRGLNCVFSSPAGTF